MSFLNSFIFCSAGQCNFHRFLFLSVSPIDPIHPVFERTFICPHIPERRIEFFELLHCGLGIFTQKQRENTSRCQ